ncbi:bifunctional aldolase/short-chain dehydrogenase [Desulfurivibrio sp. C05AmB]|jgi:rhamnose utilization protein RhaD (predicted bifunctional aldolase and dehydrogenase)/NAD(P)-dependent dehydrogenase (short-subunit alcohol dehydrogenase family)|uniref:bifunctional aldolase/short-chain dehydrogenase n=1 Tax=Desulfurivibrio sp. C05AmB TaxID=3374371 RepID=UPI00376EFA5C
MKNRFDTLEAREFVAARPGCSEHLALRIYTSRLLGRESDLVLHGGGNTSVKDLTPNLLGEEMEVLYIKGSGWDLGRIEAAGFPALDLAWLRRLRVLETLSDEEMVNQFRTHMLDSTAPNPSIETLVHAFLPHRFIDHTHADAIVALTHLPEPETRLREALGDKIGILPFIMPGFPLAQAMAQLYEARPEIEAVILLQHGIFTFADQAQTAYDRMIAYVTRAEHYLAAAAPAASPRPAGPAPEAAAPDPVRWLPLLRGALSFEQEGAGRRYFSLELRQKPELLAALARPGARELLVSGVLTPDHVIRTKNYPLFLDPATAGPAPAEPELAALVKSAVSAYEQDYRAYFQRQSSRAAEAKTILDPRPRVILVPGLGLIGAGFSPKDAAIAADIAEHTILTKQQGAVLGSYQDLAEEHIFAMEYWSLEQAKLGKSQLAPLAGRVALVTGGGGAMAVGIAAKLLAAGARVFLSDIDAGRLATVAAKLRPRFGAALVDTVVMDVSAEESVKAGMAEIVRRAGGLDILVPNAGIALVARLEELTTTDLARVMAVNCHGVFTVIKHAVPIFRRQNYGGQIIINSSKNVFDPGAAFGAYSASKAAAHQLGKIAALELAEIGVRVNMINADAVFDADGVSSGLWDVVGPERMEARKLDPAGLRDYYRNRNLLKATVLAEHVGNAVVFFAAGLTPTTGATLPVDGGIPAAFPR